MDGGYCGEVTLTLATGNARTPIFVFMESELLSSRMMLSREEARALGAALRVIADMQTSTA